MAPSYSSEVQTFLGRFEQASNNGDAGGLGDLFCGVFMNLDPHSAAPVSREALVATLPAREKLFGSIGAAGADLESVAETPLDDEHVLVETTWRTRFAQDAPSQEPLILHSTFLLHRQDGQWRVAVYLNHQDILATIRERSAKPHGTRG